MFVETKHTGEKLSFRDPISLLATKVFPKSQSKPILAALNYQPASQLSIDIEE